MLSADMAGGVAVVLTWRAGARILAVFHADVACGIIPRDRKRPGFDGRAKCLAMTPRADVAPHRVDARYAHCTKCDESRVLTWHVVARDDLQVRAYVGLWT